MQTGNPLNFEILENFLNSDEKLSLSTDATQKIEKAFNYLQNKISNNSESFYGINTGFGSLYNKKISDTDLETLQENLLKSHACGMGNEVPENITRLMLILKAQSLSYGHSGVQLSTVQRLIDFYNLKITPVVYEQGSLGASGDLSPLAHLCLPLIGLGEVYFNNKKIPAAEALKLNGLIPVKLKAKEGLALINGTQFMAAYGVWCILKFRKLFAKANLVAAMSLDAFDCRIEPFLPYSHAIRPHHGQSLVAETIFNYLKGSELIERKKEHVQDPYSFRCIPQVHGASLDVLMHVENTFLTEINSVTDNPNIFPNEDLILSAGNFHGQPLAMQLDFFCIAAAELGSISERRTYKLISGERGLPAFLVKNP
ncbi:MAG: aromatic amino acid lyase, partial [Bacteroidia bacterium]|nr:aromatic amino acid lyase [Bacteroidia bacterium]